MRNLENQNYNKILKLFIKSKKITNSLPNPITVITTIVLKTDGFKCSFSVDSSCNHHGNFCFFFCVDY